MQNTSTTVITVIINNNLLHIPIFGSFLSMQLKASHRAIFIDRVLLCAWQETGFSHDIPTTLQRSKADCPVPEVLLSSITFATILYIVSYATWILCASYNTQEMITVSVDGSVLDQIAKIMSYLRLGSSGKVLKKKKKEKDGKGVSVAFLHYCLVFFFSFIIIFIILLVQSQIILLF